MATNTETVAAGQLVFPWWVLEREAGWRILIITSMQTLTATVTSSCSGGGGGAFRIVLLRQRTIDWLLNSSEFRLRQHLVCLTDGLLRLEYQCCLSKTACPSCPVTKGRTPIPL